MRDFSNNEILVRVKEVSTDVNGLGQTMLKALQERLA